MDINQPSSTAHQVKVQCPVCLDYTSRTIDTECKHTFCIKCIFKWIFQCVDERDTINCPLCRQQIRLNRLKWKASKVITDYLLHPSSIAPSLVKRSSGKIGGKNGNGETPQKSSKKEKKIKKIPEMSESRVKKFQKLFAQKIPDNERLINYFSCALVADILLQGHLYVSENYFSFYSNVFGYVTKLVIPVASVTFISKEKTAKMFPNAIGIQLCDAKHVFGSFISRETAYQLMMGMTKKLSLIEDKNDEIDGISGDVKEDEVEEEEIEEIPSSKDDSSSLSSENQQSSENVTVTEAKVPTNPNPVPIQQQHTTFEVIQEQKSSQQQPQKLLFIGIALTLILAFLTAFLLVRINSIENRTLMYPRDYTKMTIEEAENALDRNLMTVRNVRRKLEELQMILQNSNFNENSHEHEL